MSRGIFHVLLSALIIINILNMFIASNLSFTIVEGNEILNGSFLEKSAESCAAISQGTASKLNFETDGWDEFVYVDGNKTRLTVGVKDENETLLPMLEEIAEKHQAVIVNTISIRGNIRVIVELPLTSVTAFVQETREIGLASYVEPNVRVNAQYVPNDPNWNTQWGPQKIQADWAWNITFGTHDILVAVVDTGIYYYHPDLAANYVPLGYDWVNMDADPLDDHGHGTHCAGIIAAVMNNSIGIAGLAQVRIMAEKVLNSGGFGFDDWVANGIIHAVDAGAKIISMSLGGYGESQLLYDAVKYAYDSGVLLIAAAGNDNLDMKLYPAAYDEVIAVAATDQYDQKAWFSNWGYWIELAAPGVDIYSTVPYGYESWSGTSMATPHVSGVAALVWSLCPSKTRDWVRLQLRHTSDDLWLPGFDMYYGYGRVNAKKAVEQASLAHELVAYEWEAPSYVNPGALVAINATVLNFGENNETNVLVQLLVNGTLIDSTLIDFLANGSSASISLMWEATVEGLYYVKLYVEPVPGETNIENNVLWKYIYVGFPVKAVILHSSGNIFSNIITNWLILNNEWWRFGDTAIHIDYATLNKDNITYEDIASTKADVLIISCAFSSLLGWEFTDSEIEAIKQYVWEGHGLIATAGTLFYDVPNNNKLAPLFGLNENITWNATGTNRLNLLNITHPLFSKIPNPFTFMLVGTNIPSDGQWDSNELVDGEYLALGTTRESAIVVCQGLVYISPWLEYVPPSYVYNLQLLYNAITWSRYQRLDHELKVDLKTSSFLKRNELALIEATVRNRGLNNETNVEFLLSINEAVVNHVLIPELPANSYYTVSYPWIPAVGGTNYNVTAHALPVPGENITSNNRVTKMVYVSFYAKEQLSPRWVGAGDAMEWHDDDNSWEYTLPFEFPFYGIKYKTIYISSNGLITFAGPDASYGNTIPNLASKLAIAPAWDDWSTISSYDIYIWENSTHVGIRWDVYSFGPNVYANFEALLRIDGVIQFNYGVVTGLVSATIGISNGAGDILAEDVKNLNYFNTVVFTPVLPSYNLTILATGGGATDPPSGIYSYTSGSSVLVTAIPNVGYSFEYWEFDGVNVGSANSYVILMYQNHTIKAIFAALPPPLSLSINPLSATIPFGRSVAFKATVSGGYKPYAYQWYLNGAPVSGATSASWAFNPATAGIYYVHLEVIDAKGNMVQSDMARITVAAVPVGGYSIAMQVSIKAEPTTFYVALTAILALAFTTIKRKTTKKTKMQRKNFT